MHEQSPFGTLLLALLNLRRLQHGLSALGYVGPRGPHPGQCRQHSYLMNLNRSLSLDGSLRIFARFIKYSASLGLPVGPYAPRTEVYI